VMKNPDSKDFAARLLSMSQEERDWEMMLISLPGFWDRSIASQEQGQSWAEFAEGECARLNNQIHAVRLIKFYVTKPDCTADDLRSIDQTNLLPGDAATLNRVIAQLDTITMLRAQVAASEAELAVRSAASNDQALWIQHALSRASQHGWKDVPEGEEPKLDGNGMSAWDYVWARMQTALASGKTVDEFWSGEV
jgi:hypothetical protein